MPVGEITNIAEMIDMAIGCPEVGVVDFNMLSAVLHCLAQQVGVREKNVELRGQLSSFKDPSHTVAVTEFVYETDSPGADAALETISKKDEMSPAKNSDNTILVVERITREGQEKQEGTEDMSEDRSRKTTGRTKSSEGKPQKEHAKKEAKGHAKKDEEEVGETDGQSHAERADSAAKLTGKLSLVTMSKFNLLEITVSDLKDRVYGSIPKNEDLLQEVRSSTNLKAITDMWTSLNVSSRLEAAEAGLSKLSSLLQDIINDPSKLQQMHDNTEALPTEGGASAPSGGAAVPADVHQMKETISYLQADVNNLTNMFNQAMDSLRSAHIEGVPEKLVCTTTTALEEAEGEATAVDEGATEASAPDAASAAGTAGGTTGGSTRPSVTSKAGTGHLEIAALVDRVIEVETQLKICCEEVAKRDGGLRDKVSSLQDQVEGLQKSLSEIEGGGGAGPVKNIDELMKVCETVNTLQEQLKEVHEAAKELNNEKQARQHSTNALLEQIELLKTIKLDREDMEEAMADKVNMQMLTRKVSREQFEMACNDLAKGLEITLGKLNNQEALWQQALDDIQREIETKLDKMELSPVKDFFSNKLKKLQENLKQMASLRHDIQAAGTKKKLLRDVKCISCDQDAVMLTEAQSSGVAKSMPPSLSMKPYLTYELDTIRKQQQSSVPQRNLHDWETIDKQMSNQQHPKIGRARSATDKHLCNRYCGGSHTVTTPAQRVARVGHFMKQWGPDVVPMSSGMAAGDDGKYYKVSDAQREKVGPGGARDQPPPPPSAKEGSKASDRGIPIIRGDDCRCLEPEKDHKK